eukprot:6349138-Alexandrium_andersonii.AAC.1
MLRLCESVGFLALRLCLTGTGSEPVPYLGIACPVQLGVYPSARALRSALRHALLARRSRFQE